MLYKKLLTLSYPIMNNVYLPLILLNEYCIVLYCRSGRDSNGELDTLDSRQFEPRHFSTGLVDQYCMDTYGTADLRALNS